MRVLLVEDDAMIGKGLVTALRDAGMSVDWARTGPDGEAALQAGGYAVVLLDIGLPERSGMEVLSGLRERGDATPVLIISARDGLDDRVAGLDIGADDYLVKPFEMRELLSRMRALLRRRSGSATSRIGNGEVEIDLATHRLAYRGTEAELSAREFGLMRALAERPGTILSRAQLEEKIYGWDEEVESNAVEVLIYAIRKRFGKDIIRNVRGAGWLIERDGR